jgi:hypothetical protein
MRLKIEEGERSMLKLVSRFILEVLPYVLTALIAAIVVPGFLSSQLHGSQPGALKRAERAVSAFELVRDDHSAYAREQGIRSQPSSPLHYQLTAK